MFKYKLHHNTITYPVPPNKVDFLPTHKKQTKKPVFAKRAKKSAVKKAHAKQHANTTKQNAKSKSHVVQKKPAKELRREKDEAIAKAHAVADTLKAESLLGNSNFNQHISDTLGAVAPEILRSLVKNPKTDEDIAVQHNVKVNDVRRLLNMMNGYGIVKYDVSKDNKGWLIFKWKLNNEKLEDYISKLEAEATTSEIPNLPGNCNDFFICKKCYSTQKVVLPFDSAFESGFNCESCGKPYAILNKEETIALFNNPASK
jgi:transcription factor E